MPNDEILFAAGGTGGHLYPAQALARDLQEEGHSVHFAGKGLHQSPFFDRDQFTYSELDSSSPYQRRRFRAAWQLGKGVVQALQLLHKKKPKLIVGFGSFYAFPLLAAARIKKVPYVLVEPNAHPGRVNRLFSKKAQFTAVQFGDASEGLQGATKELAVPLWARGELLAKEESRQGYGLDPHLTTLLVFGGSGGAKTINQAALTIALEEPFQVLHLCGSEDEVAHLQMSYDNRGVRAAVLAYEPNIRSAYSVADLVICRAGAATLSELLAHALPSVLVPWSKAVENHQEKNALALYREGGAILLLESDLDQISQKVHEALKTRVEMKAALEKMNQKEGIICHLRTYMA